LDIAYFTTFNNFSEALNFECLLLLRIGASILFAFLLGLEREVTGKFAGLRTHILVSAGACVFTLLSIFAFKMQIMDGFAGVNDPARIAAQIITGIGFIGAGTVMRHGNNIYGITTAATLWMCAAIGMACGTGMFLMAATATIFSLIVLVLVRKFERNFLSSKSYESKLMEIKLSSSILYIEQMNELVDKGFNKIQKIERKIVNDEKGSYIVIKMRILSNCPLSDVNDIFKDKNFIEKLEIQEIYE